MFTAQAAACGSAGRPGERGPGRAPAPAPAGPGSVPCSRDWRFNLDACSEHKWIAKLVVCQNRPSPPSGGGRQGRGKSRFLSHLDRQRRRPRADQPPAASATARISAPARAWWWKAAVPLCATQTPRESCRPHPPSAGVCQPPPPPAYGVGRAGARPDVSDVMQPVVNDARRKVVQRDARRILRGHVWAWDWPCRIPPPRPAPCHPWRHI